MQATSPVARSEAGPPPETIDALKAELAETRAQLQESRLELARLVRLAEADLRRWRPGERSNVGVSKRRPAPEQVATRLAHLVRLAMTREGRFKPGVDKRTVLSWLQQSGFFDPAYYLEANPDLKENGMDPGVHYLDYGMKEGRLPSAL